MTIQATPSEKSYAADGVTTVFAIPFPFDTAADLKLTSTDSTGNIVTLSSGFAISGGAGSTGNATFAVAPAAGLTITIYDNPAITQPTNYVSLDAFPAESHERALDRVTRIAKRLYQLVQRSVRFPDGDVSTDGVLGSVANRKGKYLFFNAVTGAIEYAANIVTTTLSQSLIGGLLNPQTTAESLAGVTPVNLAYPTLNIKRYGAVGDGVTDDGPALRTAWKVAKQQGGGTIVLPFGATYLVSSLDSPSSLNLPSQNSDGSVTTSSFQVLLYFQGGNNIVIDFQGSTIKSSVIFGGVLMIFDACTNIRVLGPKFLGAQVQSTGVVTLGAITGGSGYTNGVYNNVPLTGGLGGGATAAITVAGGAVTAVTVLYPGGSYALSDVLSASNTNLGGAGSGFTVPITSISGAGPTVLVASQNALVVSSLGGPSSNVTVTDLSVETCYTGFWAIASGNNNNQITGISLLGYTRVRNGEYGVALHNGGDYCLIENLYTYRVNRPFFFYGVQQVNLLKCFGEQNAFGFQPIVKSYSRITRDITIKYTAANATGQSGAVQDLAIQVQCDPAVINPPPTVQNIFIDYDELNYKNGGSGIQFDYYAGAGGLVQTGTSSNPLFINIIIKGFSNNKLQTTVQLTTAAAQCLINYDLFQYARPAAANDLNNNNGFVVSRKFTYTPPILFGGAATGWTFSTQSADYYIQGGLCTVIGQITVTAKGSAAGTCTLTMPFPTRADSSRTPLVHAIGVNNMAILPGAILGYFSSATATVNLVTQGAAAVAAVTDAHFTNTSNLIFQASYPL